LISREQHRARCISNFRNTDGFVIATIFLVGLIAFFIWLKNDAESRGKSGCLVCLLVFFLQIPGLIIWLLIRPEKTPESRLRDR
jgi:hypothetical protein